MDDLPSLTERLSRAEAEIRDQEQRLIEQEHRLVRVVTNLFKAFDQYQKGDPRREAAVRAVFWRIFSPATVAVSLSGFAATVGLYVAWQANGLLSEQNRLISAQNTLAESSRRSGLIVELSEVNNDLRDAAKSQKRVVRTSDRFDYSLSPACASTNAPTTKGLSGVSHSIEYTKPNLSSNKVVDPEPALVGRLVALSRAFKPYQYLDQEISKELTSPLSPERAQLLISVITAGVNAQAFHSRGANFSNSDFRDANLNSLDFSAALLDLAEFTGSQLVNANFRHARLMSAKFVDANAICADFFGADLRYIDAREMTLDGANLRCAKVSESTFKGASLSNADLRGARYQGNDGVDKIVTEDWLKTINGTSSGAILGAFEDCMN